MLGLPTQAAPLAKAVSLATKEAARLQIRSEQHGKGMIPAVAADADYPIK